MKLVLLPKIVLTVTSASIPACFIIVRHKCVSPGLNCLRSRILTFWNRYPKIPKYFSITIFPQQNWHIILFYYTGCFRLNVKKYLNNIPLQSCSHFNYDYQLIYQYLPLSKMLCFYTSILIHSLKISNLINIQKSIPLSIVQSLYYNANKSQNKQQNAAMQQSSTFL